MSAELIRYQRDKNSGDCMQLHLTGNAPGYPAVIIPKFERSRVTRRLEMKHHRELSGQTMYFPYKSEKNCQMDFRKLISIKNRSRTIIYLPINIGRKKFFFECSSKNFNLDFLKMSLFSFQTSKCYNSPKNWAFGTIFLLQLLFTSTMRYD